MKYRFHFDFDLLVPKGLIQGYLVSFWGQDQQLNRLRKSLGNVSQNDTENIGHLDSIIKLVRMNVFER